MIRGMHILDDILQDDQTPLHLSASAGHLEVVKLLLEEGADKEARDEVGVL